MNVIVMGCGRVGSQLALMLAAANHAVTVIDERPEAFQRLKPRFRGRTLTGGGTDRQTLVQAGIETADAFAAASSSDNANIVAARIAKHIFHVPKVVARLFEPRRAAVYHRLGLETMSSTEWGASRIFQMLVHSDLSPVLSFGNGEVEMVECLAPEHLLGRMVKDIAGDGEFRIVALTRDGRAFLPRADTPLQPGDRIHMAVASSAAERLERFFHLRREAPG